MNAPALGPLLQYGLRLHDLYDCKRTFVQRYVTRAIKAADAATLDKPCVALPVKIEDDLEGSELAFALKVRELIGAEFKVEMPTPELETLTRYAAWALHSPE